MYFYLSLRFAPQAGKHPQNSNAFLACKNENETSKKQMTRNKLLWPNKRKTYNIHYYNMQYHRKIITSFKTIIQFV